MTEESAVKEETPERETFRIVGDPAPLFAALAAARPDFKPIVKSKKVKVQPREGAPYEFEYAPLESIIDATAEALAKQGLYVMQPPPARGSGLEVRTMLTHSSGAYIECIMYVLGDVEFWNRDAKEWQTRRARTQELGSEITYKRRYALQGLLGVNAEDDDDGNKADGNEARPVEKHTAKPQVPQGRPKPPPAAKPSQAAQSAPQSQPEAKPSPSLGETRALEEQEQAATHAPPATDHDPATGEVPAVGPVTEATGVLLKETMRGAGITKRPQAVALLVEFCGKGAIDDLTEAEALKLLEPGNIPELMKKLGFGAP